MIFETFSVGDNVWVMHNNRAVECTVLAVKIDCFFGNERDGGNLQFDKIQLFTNKATIEMGVEYTLETCGVHGNVFKAIHGRCFVSQKDLLESL